MIRQQALISGATFGLPDAERPGDGAGDQDVIKSGAPVLVAGQGRMHQIEVTSQDARLPGGGPRIEKGACSPELGCRYVGTRDRVGCMQISDDANPLYTDRVDDPPLSPGIADLLPTQVAGCESTVDEDGVRLPG